MITDGHGIPLAVSLTGGNRNDVTQLMPLVQAIPPVRGRRGRPRRRSDAVYADRGYDHDKYRRQVRGTGIKPVIARRGTTGSSGSILAHSSSETIHGCCCPFRTARPNHHATTGIPTGHSVRSS